MNPGQHFEDLDLITKLMDIKPSNKLQQQSALSGPSTAASSAASATPLIQVLSGEKTEQDQKENKEEQNDDVEIDWNFPQSTDTMDRNVLESDAKYGFNNLYQGYGNTINELAQELIDIQDIDHSDMQSRRTQRLIAEELQFDPDYYMWDSIMNEDIPRILEYRPESYKALKRIQKQKAADNTSTATNGTSKSYLNGPPLDNLSDSYLVFTEKEQEQMRRLPNKECKYLYIQEDLLAKT